MAPTNEKQEEMGYQHTLVSDLMHSEGLNSFELNYIPI